MLLGIGKSVEEKAIIQDISKVKLRLDHALEQLNIQEDHETKVKATWLLIEKRKDLEDTIKQLIAVEHFVTDVSEKEKQIEELSAKKLVLMKEVMIEEARQINPSITSDDIKKIEEKIDQSSQSQSAGQDNGGSKANNVQGNSNTGNSNPGNKGNSSDKSNNGNKGGNDKSNK